MEVFQTLTGPVIRQSPTLPRRVLTLTGLAAVAAALGLIIRNAQPPENDARQPIQPAAATPDAKHVDRPTGHSATRTRIPSRAAAESPKLSFDPVIPPSADAWPSVIDALLNAPDGEQAHAAMAMIQTHGGPDQIAELTRSFDNAPQSPRSRRILTTLSQLRADAALNAARDLLSETHRAPDDPLVRAAARSLVRRGDPADLDRIFKRLDATPDPDAQSALAQVLATASHPSSEAFLIGTAAGHGNSTSPHARAAAATALRNFPSLPSTDALHRLATTDPNPLIRQAARRALDAIQTPE